MKLATDQPVSAGVFADGPDDARVSQLLDEIDQLATPSRLEVDKRLQEIIAIYQYYPERLVMVLWTWGGGDLHGIDQPDEWQMSFLRKLGEYLRDRDFNGVDAAKPIKMGRGSGRQIGKSALVGMVITLLMSAFPDAKITITANTDSQLDTKTWPEVLSWLKSSIVKDWFEWNSGLIWREDARDTWFCARVTWNLENPQAFAGQGNRRSINVVIFDEASTIPHAIWDVTLGGLSTGLPIFLTFGNMTEASGDFADAIVGPDGKYWDSVESIDARTCRFPNKEKLDEEIEKYGIDSDYCRVWILGLPPRGNIHGYFGEDLIQECRKARPRGLASDALVAAVDFAWGGDDSNKIRFREGLDAWSIKPIEVPGRETARPEKMIQVLANLMHRQWPVTSGGYKKIAMLFGDGSGICTEVFAGLYTLGIRDVMAVNWSGVPRDKKIDLNIKAQIMRGLRDLMLAGLGVDDSDDLLHDMRELLAVNFMPLQFEKKELMKKRLGRSTDDLDALAMTTYMPVKIKPKAAYAQPYRVASAYS